MSQFVDMVGNLGLSSSACPYRCLRACLVLNHDVHKSYDEVESTFYNVLDVNLSLSPHTQIS